MRVAFEMGFPGVTCEAARVDQEDDALWAEALSAAEVGRRLWLWSLHGFVSLAWVALPNTRARAHTHTFSHTHTHSHTSRRPRQREPGRTAAAAPGASTARLQEQQQGQQQEQEEEAKEAP